MTARYRRLWRVAAPACLTVAAAALCRAIVLTTACRYLENLANFVRIYLYLGLFAVWGASVRRRVMQAQVRGYLVAVAALEVFWLTVREFRWQLVLNPDAQRWLWYWYYVPLIWIPLLALLVSMSLGKGEHYRLPGRTALLYVPTALFIALVLSNDLHQWVFTFPEQGAARAALDYRYGPLYYAVSAWIIFCALSAFLLMLAQCRIPRTNQFLWLPLVPFGGAILYAVLYMLRVPFVVNALGDLAVLDCLIFTAFLESCIQCGLIQSNTRYYDLFRASVDISAQIVDRDRVPRYAARDALLFSEEEIERAEAAPVDLPDGKRLHSMPVNGGRVVWSEDIAELLALRERLESVQEELSDRNEIVRMEYVQEKEQKTVEEQNRLYDLMQQKTQSQLDQVKLLAAAWQKAEDAEEKQRLLARLVVLGSFIKRRKDFVLSQQGASAVTDHTLSSAFAESFRSLALLDIRGAYYVNTGGRPGAGAQLATAYDFFELFMESVLDTAHYLNVRVSVVGGRLRCMLDTDGVPDAEALSRRYPGLQLERGEDGGTECILPMEGGGAA